MTLFKLSQVSKGTVKQYNDDKNDHVPNVIHHHGPGLNLLKSPKTNSNMAQALETSAIAMMTCDSGALQTLQNVTNTANKYCHIVTCSNKTNGQNSSNQQNNNNQDTNENSNEQKDDDHVAPSNNNNNHNDNSNTNNNANNDGNNDENENKNNGSYIAADASESSDEEEDEEAEAEEEETKMVECDEEQMDQDISDICAELSFERELSDILSVDESADCGAVSTVSADIVIPMNPTATTPVTPSPIIHKNKNKNNKKRKTKKRKKLRGGDRLLSASYNPLPSYRAQGNIQISKQFTAEMIPCSIAENIDNLYGFMDKCTALCLMDDSHVVSGAGGSGGDLRIFNYGFHCKLTGESLFCVVRRQDVAVNASRGYKWKMMSKLYRYCDLIAEFWTMSINTATLPQSLYDSSIYKSYLREQQRILSVISNVESLEALMVNTQWHRVDIFNRINNKRRMHLFLTKPEFMKECRNYVLNEDHLSACALIPILMFNNDCNEYWIEHVWIIQIDVEDISIGISFKYTSNKSVKVTGIHLDRDHLQDQHEVILPNHECHCFDTFSSNINYLSIGNPDDSLNKIKYYKQQIEELTKCKEHLQEENKKRTHRSQYLYYNPHVSPSHSHSHSHNNQYNQYAAFNQMNIQSNQANHIINNANINEQMFKM